MASVTLEGITKVYEEGRQRHEAVKAISLAIPDHEFLVLVGPSGCGKSTVLRMIAGLEDVTAGAIRFSDRDVTGVAAQHRNIAMVFQSYALYPHKTVYGNLAFALELAGMPRAEIDRRVRAAAEQLGIGELLQRRPRQLSGGQRQRVAVGRAIVRQPDVFLFDEPLSNLDAKLRVQMRRELAALHRRLGTTMIYVTHDQVEAMTLGDRIAVMLAGEIRQVATPLELYGQPADTFVATFIGNPPMNLLTGTLADGAFTSEEGAVRLALPAGEIPAAVRVVLGIRPEAVRLEAAGGPGCAGVIEHVEPLGNETLVTVRSGAATVTARVAAAAPVQPEQQVSWSAAPASLHWFDAGHGRRLDSARG